MDIWPGASGTSTDDRGFTVADLHYIWYGPVPTDDWKYATPIQMAKVCPNHQVIFWCKRDYVDAFQLHLGPGVQVRACDALDTVTDEAPSQEMREWYDGAMQALDALDRARAWSACKDLVSLLVLYGFGGYYMDTTTLIAPSAEPAAIRAGFDATYASPRLPRLADTGLRHQLLLQTGEAIVSGRDDRVDDAGTFTLPLVDVWAFYSPRYDECMANIFVSYVSRCMRLGLNDNGELANFDAIAGDDELRTLGRDTLIGQLIIRSVYDGLIEQAYRDLSVQGNDDPDKDAVAQQVLAYTWPTAAPPQDAHAHVALPTLHIDKRYTGSWRNLVDQQQ